MKPRCIDIDGKQYLWCGIVELRRQQLTAWREAQEPVLFQLRDDLRPASQQTSAGRYLEPTLFNCADRTGAR